MFGNFAATIDTKDKVVQAYPGVRLRVPRLRPGVQHQRRGRLEAVRPEAEGLRGRGRLLLGQPFPNLQNLLDAAAQLDYEPIWFTDANFYAAVLRRVEHRAATATTSTSARRSPRSRRPTRPGHPAVHRHRRARRRRHQPARPAGDVGLPAVGHGGQGVRRELTRDCVLDELTQITSWTAAACTPRPTRARTCRPSAAVLKLDGTGGAVDPEEPGEFDCDPDGGPSDAAGRRPGRARTRTASPPKYASMT